jgi:hypothetical protein
MPDSEKHNETILKEESHSYGSAWREAEASGIDMSLLEHSLRLTVWERLVEHQHAFELVQMLQGAKIRRHG